MKINTRFDLERAREAIDKEMNDGIPIKTIKHPQLTPWWKRVLHFFKKPKFSSSSLEVAKPFIVLDEAANVDWDKLKNTSVFDSLEKERRIQWAFLLHKVGFWTDKELFDFLRKVYNLDQD